MASNISDTSADNLLDINADLISKYIKGTGIELTTRNEPMDIPKNVDITYVNAKWELLDYFPTDSVLTDVNVNGLKQAMEGKQYDFCIARHILDRDNDPVGSIRLMIKSLKNGGVLYLIFSAGGSDSRDDRSMSETDMFIESLCKDGANGPLKIVELMDNEAAGERIAVIEKNGYVDEILRILGSRSGTKDRPAGTVDVVIPVFNAYDDLLKCLLSAIVCQDGYRIILIDDMSSDPRISDLFSRLKKFESDGLLILKNPENLGFVKTVNIGMKQSSDDVLLLNSDTIVTSGWVKKIKHCAYSDDRIATVTPFTNSGTICSIPCFCKSNDIPAGFTVDTFATFVEAISVRKYPEIPTAVGFCMYIRRDSLNKVGYFNEEKFGKGYSEENDFCMRAVKLGFKNVLCDDTFVFHKGSASFLTDKAAFIEKNLKILNQMHPEYLRIVANFCNSNPLETLQENVKLRMQTWDTTGRKKRVLYILHHLGGGTEKYAIEMVRSFAHDNVSYVLQVFDKQMILTEYNNGSKLAYIFNISHPITTETIHDPEYAEIVEKILSTFTIELVHIHHLIGHTLDIFNVAKDMKIPVIYTPNDYYCICPAIFLVDKDQKYCENVLDVNKCSECLAIKCNLKKGFIIEWRKNFQAALDATDMIVASNPYVMDILRKCYRLRDDRTMIIEPGHTQELQELSKSRVDRDINKPFVIAFIGGLGKSHKGYDVFYRLAKSGKLADKTRWMIVGISETHDVQGYYPDCNIYVYGRFKDYREIASVLQGVDLVINPSLCETFSYTLSEAWSAGIPVLVSNMGAMKERVERTGGGWCVDVSDVKEVEKKIVDIISSPEDYRRKKEAARRIELKSVDATQAEYKELYARLISGASPVFGMEFVLSQNEIIEALNGERSKINNVVENGPSKIYNENLGLSGRLIKCYKENGLVYTVNRLSHYIRDR